ncbi:MAG: helix-turn-helix domain-containing protein [Propionibacteriaceae bacterium]|nr:helix-turn-helix domain-containing protein [Propionibacteriaceae bacterium]
MQERTVVIVVFDGVQGLDVFGPADVFYFANYLAGRAGETLMPYRIELAARQVGPVRTAAGPRIHADRAMSDEGLFPDLLLVAGGLSVHEAAGDAGFRADLAALASRSAEVGSICTGAALLAEVGLLDGRKATTHWALADGLAASHPSIELDADRIFVHDGVWTSAGVTAGIDLALEILRQHHGTEMAAQAARNLVVYLQRAGGQQQYSAHLAAQRASDQTILDLLAHIADHPGADLTVTGLADHVGMAPRSFQRLFTREVGTSPGAYVEQVRIDAARRLLERTDDSLARISRQCGYASVETFHRSFRRLIGVTPGEYRGRFRRSSA